MESRKVIREAASSGTDGDRPDREGFASFASPHEGSTSADIPRGPCVEPGPPLTAIDFIVIPSAGLGKVSSSAPFRIIIDIPRDSRGIED